jgi:hypothetical protein
MDICNNRGGDVDKTRGLADLERYALGRILVWSQWRVTVHVQPSEAHVRCRDAQDTGKDALWSLHDEAEHSFRCLWAGEAVSITLIVYDNNGPCIHTACDVLMSREISLKVLFCDIACAQWQLLFEVWF